MPCRISGIDDLVPVIDLGPQAYTGFFPNDSDYDLPVAPLSVGLSEGTGLLQMIES